MLEVINMKNLTRLFKVLAKIVGVLCLIYGFIVGFGGTGPDGPHHSTSLTAIGIYIFFLGAIYLWPSHNFTDKLIKTIIYVAITLTPIVGIIGIATYTIYIDGLNSFLIQGGHISLTSYLILSLFAPLSMVLEYKEKHF